MRRQLDLLAQQPREHAVHALDHVVEAEHLRLEHLLAAVREQLLGQRRGPFAGAAHLLDVAAHRVVVGHLGEGEVAVARDRGQQVVEVVRDPARELADRLHLLRLAELLLEVEALRLVDAERGQALELAVLGVHEPVAPGDAALLAALREERILELLRHRAVHHRVLEHLPHLGIALARREEVEPVAAGHLLAGIAGDALRLGVERGDPPERSRPTTIAFALSTSRSVGSFSRARLSRARRRPSSMRSRSVTSRMTPRIAVGRPSSPGIGAGRPSMSTQCPSRWRMRAAYGCDSPPESAFATDSRTVGIVGMDDRERVRAHEFLLGIAEQRMLGRGGVLDVPVEVEAQDHVARALDDRAVELLALAQILVHPRAVERERREVAEAAKQRELGPAERAPEPVRHDAEHADDIGAGSKRDAGCRPVEPGSSKRSARPGQAP